jgi:hypothetical protein
MRQYFEIPTTAQAQRMNIQLGSTIYVLSLWWNEFAGSWVLDISDESENLILSGIPLVTGTDLLGQHKHLGIPGSLVVQSDNDVFEVPTAVSLGSTGRLYFVTGEP